MEKNINTSSKPNVLLIVPRYFSTPQCGYIMPLGLLYVSAALKQSDVCNVFTINLNHQEEDDKTVLERIISEQKIDMVGSSGISGQFIEVFPLLKLVKQIKPHIITIVGGGMITADAQTAMEAFEGLADYGVIGEGEITDVELIQTLADKGDIAKVDGVIYQKNGQWVQTNRRQDITNLDGIALPDYKGFDYDKYLEMNGEVVDGVKYSPVAIVGGRSCKYNCTFCFHPSGSKYRQRSLDSIFTEIDYLIANYEVNYIALREELFASDEQRVIDFCNRIKSYPLVWSIQLRVDSVTPHMVDVLKNSNCRYVFLGIESADNEILKSMRKHITIEQVEYALDLTINAGLDTRSTIILGDSIESPESARRTINWWKSHKHRSAIDLGMIIAFPGSTLYHRARKNGRIPNPHQFLHDGCPIINLSSKMTNDEYVAMAKEVQVLSGIPFSPKCYT